MAFGKAATPAATSAAPPFFDPVDLVNLDVAVPAAERYPGAVDPAQYADYPDYLPTTPGGPGDVLYGDWQGQPFREALPEQASGGGFQTTDWLTGNDAPVVPWDSNSAEDDRGNPLTPPGPVNQEIHGEDTGVVRRFEHVIPAAIGTAFRRTQTGQTTVRNGTGDQVMKDNVVTPNNRQNLDQYQVYNPDGPNGGGGYQPWEIPYAERPIMNNVAWEAQPMQVSNAPYTPSGYLPDRSPYDAGLAVAYEAPPDPYVTTTPVGPGSPGISGGWLSG